MRQIKLLPLVVAFLSVAGLVFAQPPVVPPMIGANVTTSTSIQCSGTVKEAESLNWVYVDEIDAAGNRPVPNGPPGVMPLQMGPNDRAAQVRYVHKYRAIDGVTDFAKDFTARIQPAVPNVEAAVDYGYSAWDPMVSLRAGVSSSEKIGVSMVTYGDIAGVGGMQGLCPFSNPEQPPTNTFVAAGHTVPFASAMVVHSASDAQVTDDPMLHHTVTAAGLGSIRSAMNVSQWQGGMAERFVPGNAPLNPQGLAVYTHTASASGEIAGFSDGMAWASVIPTSTQPEPFFAIPVP